MLSEHPELGEDWQMIDGADAMSPVSAAAVGTWGGFMPRTHNLMRIAALGSFGTPGRFYGVPISPEPHANSARTAFTDGESEID